MSNWKNVCKYPKKVNVDFEDFVSDSEEKLSSPIDTFLKRCKELITLHGDFYDSKKEEIVSQLVVASAVGACEELFRDILDVTTSNCPISRKNLRSNELRIDLVDKYGSSNLCRAFTQNESLTSRKKIEKVCRKTTGINISNKDIMKKKLTQFEKIANIRHAAIHASGILSHANISALSNRPLDLEIPAKIVTNVRNVHNVIEVVMSTGRAFNRSMLSLIVERWIKMSALEGSWKIDKQIVEPIFEGFYSTVDMDDELNAKCMYKKFSYTF